MRETLASAGEFGLIHRIEEILKSEGVQRTDVSQGIGDDAACFRPRSGYEILVTCDCMVERRHYLPEHFSPLQLGGRAMVMNISDIGAMGGEPLYAVVSLGLSAAAAIADVEAMYRGFIAELNPLGASIIGGNVTESGAAGFIDITLIGQVEEGKILRRSTAVPGHAILVTGFPGQASAGLKMLMQGGKKGALEDHPLVRAYVAPVHRAREGKAIAGTGCATAMIDVSDGFLGDLAHICEQSHVGALIFREKLPVTEELRNAAAELGLDPHDLVLGESDDYELIITCLPENVEKIRSAVMESGGVPVTEVGIITREAGIIRLALPDGTRRPVAPSGWDHFRRQGSSHV